jgi:hypothetical protein
MSTPRSIRSVRANVLRRHRAGLTVALHQQGKIEVGERVAVEDEVIRGRYASRISRPERLVLVQVIDRQPERRTVGEATFDNLRRVQRTVTCRTPCAFNWPEDLNRHVSHHIPTASK